MGKEQKVNLPEYFGDFGGIFVADSFTPDLDRLAIAADEKIITDSFQQNFIEIIKDIAPSVIDFKEYELANGGKLIQTPSLAEYYNTAGQVTLGAELGVELIVSGAETPQLALAFGKACQALNRNGLLYLNRQTGENEELLSELEKLSCEVDTKTCRELFNIPQMYAFQKYMENRSERYFVPLEANVGPYPFPALAGYFAGIFGEAMSISLPRTPECCVIPIKTGTSAIGVFRALAASGCKLVTVEEPVAQEYHGVFCGAYTITAKMSSGQEEGNALCPELVSLWRKGDVIRLGCDHYGPVATDTLGDVPFSPQLSRAIALAVNNTGYKDMLVLEAVS
jgi:tryptophan synthase beta subunit